MGNDPDQAVEDPDGGISSKLTLRVVLTAQLTDGGRETDYEGAFLKAGAVWRMGIPGRPFKLLDCQAPRKLELRQAEPQQRRGGPRCGRGTTQSRS
jgi:hypothetical protein